MWRSKATKSITVAGKLQWGGGESRCRWALQEHTPQWHAFSSSWSFSLPAIMLPSGDKTASMCTGGGYLISDYNNMHVTFGFPSVGGQTAKLLSVICRSGRHWCPCICSGHCSHQCSVPSWHLLLFQSSKTHCCLERCAFMPTPALCLWPLPPADDLW